MKKYQLGLAAIGLMGVLASCDSGGGVISTNPPTMTNASGLYTNWQLSATATDTGTGTVYPAGTYVICDNKQTTVELNVAWSGYLYDLDVYANGGYYGDTHYLGSASAGGAASGSAPLSFAFNAGAAPLSVGSSLKAQSIIVTPVTTINVKGQTSIIVQGNNYYGDAGNYLTSTTLNTVPDATHIPVVNCQ